MLDVSLDKVQVAVLTVIAFIVATSFHEFGHAWLATRLGDALPRREGRLTLSPRAHIDLIGTVVFPALGTLFGLPVIAWGRPVRTDPSSYRGAWRGRRGRMLVAAAGPLMNLLLAFLSSALVLAAAGSGLVSREVARQACWYLIGLNIVLMVFNLIPVPPLDGAAVLDGLVSPAFAARPRAFLRRWGMVVLFLLMMTPLLGILLLPASLLYSAWSAALLGMVR